jgi:DivIVA domain-containing protein
MGVTLRKLDQIEFRTALRGYDREQVDEFLDEVRETLSRLQYELDAATARALGVDHRLADAEARAARAEQRLNDVEAEVERRIETAVREALDQANPS